MMYERKAINAREEVGMAVLVTLRQEAEARLGYTRSLLQREVG